MKTKTSPTNWATLLDELLIRVFYLNFFVDLHKNVFVI